MKCWACESPKRVQISNHQTAQVLRLWENELNYTFVFLTGTALRKCFVTTTILVTISCPCCHHQLFAVREQFLSVGDNALFYNVNNKVWGGEKHERCCTHADSQTRTPQPLFVEVKLKVATPKPLSAQEYGCSKLNQDVGLFDKHQFR